MDSTGSDVSVTEDKNKIFQRNSLKARNKVTGIIIISQATILHIYVYT